MATMDIGVGTTKAENDFDIVLHYFLTEFPKTISNQDVISYELDIYI